MTTLQKLQLEQSEIREKIGGVLDKEDKTAEDRTEMGQLSKRAQELEVEVRAAIVIDEPETVVDTDKDDPETRELASLRRRSSIYDFVDEAVHGRGVDGASQEFRQAILGEDRHGYLPLDLLLDDDEQLEQRADAVSNIGTAIQENQQSIAARVFARGSAAYLGVMMPTVPVGTTSYPRITGGTTADVRSPGKELDGAAATLTTVSVNPVRLTASYTYSSESLTKVVDFEDALRSDLQAVMMDKYDNLAINGQAASGSNSPKVDGIINSLTDPTNPSDVADWEDYLAAYDDRVDGKYAMTSEEVRLLVNTNTYQQALGLTVGTSGRAGLLRDRLPRDRFRVSANMPATPTSGANDKIASAIAYAFGARNLARGFVMPTWRGIELIPDRITKAKAGQRVLTAIMHVGFAMVDNSAYSRLEFKTA